MMNNSHEKTFAELAAHRPKERSRFERHIQRFAPGYALLAAKGFVVLIGWGSGLLPLLAQQDRRHCSIEICESFAISKYEPASAKRVPNAKLTVLSKDRVARGRATTREAQLTVQSSKLLKEDSKALPVISLLPLMK